MKKTLLLIILLNMGGLFNGFAQEEQKGGDASKRGIHPEMVFIKAGAFTMGSNGNDNDEKPVHRTTVLKSFYLGKYEVTFDQYDLYCTVTGVKQPDDEGWGRGSRPVINVSWNEAKAYAAWLSGVTGGKYRLPTEAEWEYAARAGSTTKYGFGDDKNGLDAHAWYVGNSKHVTHETGIKQPNQWGLYDMHGNVWEWCEDGYSHDYRFTPTDGRANEVGNKKVVRGGSWSSSAGDVRSANRFRNDPSKKRYNLGFRLAEDR